jgi:bifunctional ADP-heptose synthase (sugar kinase/adenylyltransferase)
MKIGVIGDSFLDRYWLGKVKGLSAEAPIPKIEITNVFDCPGGAANVRLNIEALGGDVKMLFKGDKDLPNYPIKNRLITEDNLQLARWDERDWCLPLANEDLLPLIDCDAIVVSDYGKGSVGENIVKILRNTSLPLFVDCKDPRPWIGSRAIMFPNLKEFKEFAEDYSWFEKVVLKQGKEGISLVEYGNIVLTRPSLTKNVVSVCGAGDTVMAAFVVQFLRGSCFDYCLSWANAAAAVVIEKPFTSLATWFEADGMFNRYLTDFN